MTTSSLKDNPFQQILDAEKLQEETIVKLKSEMTDKVESFRLDLEKKLSEAKKSTMEKAEQIVSEAGSISNGDLDKESLVASAYRDLKSKLDEKKIVDASKKVQIFINDVILK